MKSQKQLEFEEQFSLLFGEAHDTFLQRNEIYKNGWEQHGSVLKGLFPDGIELKTDKDFERFGLVLAVSGKLCRYCANFASGGHDDSLQDMSVYANILRTVDKGEE